MNDFKNSECVIFDVETTGLAPEWGDRIVEVAALKIKDFKIADRFEALIDPRRAISWGAYQVNGITPEMLAGAPAAGEILPELMQFIGDAHLVGHNIKFDLKFLNHELTLAGQLPLPSRPALDTARMARGLLPGFGSYALSAVAYILGIQKNQEHRAMSDAEITWGVFQKLCRVAETKGLGEWEMILGLFGVPKSVRQTNLRKKQILLDAIASDALVELLYFGTNSGTTTRRVTPKQLAGEGRNAMLFGFCHLRQEERNFKIDRIVRLQKVPS